MLYSKKMFTSPCDLEVQLDGDYAFLLRQKLLAAYSGRMSRILKRSSLSRVDHGPLGIPRILLHDFPGGAEGFELATRFCYNGGRIDISNSNVAMLRCVGEFLEMTEAFARGNLVKLTEMHLQNMGTEWDSNLTVLKGCKTVVELAEKSHIVHRCADVLASRICSSIEDSSPLSSSPDSYRFHSGSISTKGSLTSSGVARSWWFADIASLPVLLMERVIKCLIYNDVDNKVVARFLIHYLRSELPVHVCNGVSTKLVPEISKASSKVQLVIFEVIVNLLFHLERGSTSCRFLFSMLRVSTGLNASKACKRQLEKMIGSQLHEASLDNILMPLYPRSSSQLYDVDLVIRLTEYFFKEQEASGMDERDSTLEPAVETPASRVGDLIDCYLAEIAPDMFLKVHKFRRLSQSLPSSARWTHDELYRAVDSFLEAHHNVLESDVISLCKVIDIEKLSFEACRHAAKNPRLPARFVLDVLAFQQGQLRDCLFKEKDFHRSRRGSGSNISEHVIEPVQLRVDLNEMQVKVSELEKACKSMKSDVTRYNRAARRLLC